MPRLPPEDSHSTASSSVSAATLCHATSTGFFVPAQSRIRCAPSFIMGRMKPRAWSGVRAGNGSGRVTSIPRRRASASASARLTV